MIHFVERLHNVKSAQVDSKTKFDVIVYNTSHWVDGMSTAAILLETKLIIAS